MYLTCMHDNSRNLRQYMIKHHGTTTVGTDLLYYSGRVYGNDAVLVVHQHTYTLMELSYLSVFSLNLRKILSVVR